MIQIFLRAKHWQIFVLGFILPMMLYMFIMFFMMFKGINLSSESEVNIASFLISLSGVFKFLPIIMLLAIGVLNGWLWSIGKGLQNYIDEEFQLNTKWFTISIIFVTAYIILFSVLMTSMMSHFFSSIAETKGQEINFFAEHLRSQFYIMALVTPFHLLAFGCSFYNLYFAAKTVKTAEFQDEVSFSDFIGEFFMFWFSPIGVWMIQPKINSWLEEEMI